MEIFIPVIVSIITSGVTLAGIIINANLNRKKAKSESEAFQQQLHDDDEKRQILQEESLRCLLRTEILKIYYKHLEDKQLRQYDAENLRKLYEAYKDLEGNTFVDDCVAEMRTWKII